MALATKLGRLSNQSLFKNKLYVYNGVRCYSDQTRLPWNFLWRPQPYSEKDHDKIAEKYHLHPKDYKINPEHESLGDYPQLPMIGPEAKDPHYPYDFPVYKKNYHEILHHNFEIMGEDRFSFGYRYRFDLFNGMMIFFGVILVSAGLCYLASFYPSVQPYMEKQYPQKGKVHYTFEPAK